MSGQLQLHPVRGGLLGVRRLMSQSDDGGRRCDLIFDQDGDFALRRAMLTQHVIASYDGL
jgi:hypothetical protein